MEKYIEFSLRYKLNQHVQISEIDKIFGINNGDILVNTVILAAKKIIFRVRLVDHEAYYKLKSGYESNEIWRVLVSFFK